MAYMPLRVQDLHISYPDRVVVDGIDFTATAGSPLALVGENGAGKSTMLRAIAGDLPTSVSVSGVIDRPSDFALLSQEPPFGNDETISDVLATALRPLRDAVAAVENLADSLDDPDIQRRYVAALEFATDHEAWDADRRSLEAAERLGIGHIDPQRQVGSLSGGQRTRLALALLMTRRPQCVLLDEPTNHLDDSAIEILTEFVRGLPGVVVFASHDRAFLDDVATALVDLDASPFGTDGSGGRRYGGGWSAYEAHRKAARQRWEETYALEQLELDRLRSVTQIGTGSIAHNRGPTDNDKFIHTFKGARVDRTLARRRKDAERRLELAEREQLPKPPPVLTLTSLPLTQGQGSFAVRARDLRVGRRLYLDRLDVAAGEHLLVTGVNGAGKSTLLGVLAGRISADSGSVEVNARRSVELMQDPVFADADASAAETYVTAVGDLTAQKHPLASLGLLAGPERGKPVGQFSVGQRRRLALAIAVATEPDLLLLDEPTNHLSLGLVSELEDALEVTAATVIAAPHDRWIRRRWAGDSHEPSSSFAKAVRCGLT